MHSIFHLAAHPNAAPARIVWLPGAYHTAQHFVDAGFPAAVLQRHMALDLVFVDLEMQHLGDRTVLERLRTQIVLPAREAKMRVWLGGISLGGLFALHYARAYPDDLAGLCLLAPYLGNRMLTAEIAQAKGLRTWQPGTIAENDEERQLWRFIQARATTAAPMYLGFGQDDRFSSAHHLLAKSLPAGAVDVIEGGHDWPTWSRLWENFLDAQVL